MYTLLDRIRHRLHIPRILPLPPLFELTQQELLADLNFGRDDDEPESAQPRPGGQP